MCLVLKSVFWYLHFKPFTAFYLYDLYLSYDGSNKQRGLTMQEKKNLMRKRWHLVDIWGIDPPLPTFCQNNRDPPFVSSLSPSPISLQPSLHPFVSPGSFIYPPSTRVCTRLRGFAPFVCMHACDFFPCVYVCTRNPSPTEMSVEPWAGTPDQAAAEDSHSTSEASSQDLEQHPDKLCLDSFWSEVETIRQGCGYPDSDCTRRDSRQSEGARLSYPALVRWKQRRMLLAGFQT